MSLKAQSKIVGLAAAAIAATLASGAAAQAPTQYLFTGTFLVTAANKGCMNMVGDTRAMSYGTVLWGMKTPKEDIKPGFVLVNSDSTVVIVPETKSFKAAGNYELTQINPWNGVATWTSTYSELKFSPSKIGASTTQVTITGKLTKFNHEDNCTVTFRAVGLRNP